MTAWTVRLTHQAELDVEAILAWTEERFGSLQAEIYMEVLARTVRSTCCAFSTTASIWRGISGRDVRESMRQITAPQRSRNLSRSGDLTT